jgi:hypothetical protein
MPKKRGRPKKYTTNSARMSAHYLQKTEGERKQLVANIIWRVRSAVAKPLGPADGYSANKQAEMLRNNALWLSQFRDKLLTLTVVPLKRFYRVLIGFTDGTGRLPDQWWAMKMTTATESPRMAQFSSAYIRTAPTFVKNSVVVNVNWHTSMHSVL